MTTTTRITLTITGGVVLALALAGGAGWAGQQNGITTGIARERAAVHATATVQAHATRMAARAQARATATQQAREIATAAAQETAWAAGATATAQAAQVSGVHVCTLANFDNTNVECTTDANTITDLSQARWVVNGPDGGDFTSATVTFVIAKQHGDGSATTVGSSTDNTFVLSDSSYSATLSSLFLLAGVTPENGEVYRIAAQEPAVSLGTTTFTYEGN